MPTDSDDPSSRRSRDTDTTLVAVAVLASFVAFLDGSVVNLALPAIGREFAHQGLAGLALQQWWLTAISSRSAR